MYPRRGISGIAGPKGGTATKKVGMVCFRFYVNGEVVTCTKQFGNINFETFQSCMMVDDDDQTLTEKEMDIVFSECNPEEKCIKLLGNPASAEVAGKYPDMLSLLQLTVAEKFPIEF